MTELNKLLRDIDDQYEGQDLEPTDDMGAARKGSTYSSLDGNIRFRCCVCRRQVTYHGTGWGYMFGDKKCCTYSCMRQAERKYREKHKIDFEQSLRAYKRHGEEDDG